MIDLNEIADEIALELGRARLREMALEKLLEARTTMPSSPIDIRAHRAHRAPPPQESPPAV